MISIEESYKQLSHVERKLLSKCLGKTIEDVPKAIIPFYRVLPRGIEYDDKVNAFFAALCVRCLYEDVVGEIVPLESIVRKVREQRQAQRSSDNADSYDNKIASLMNTVEIPVFISRLSRMMKYTAKMADGYIPDCDQLYKDICSIGSTKKTVQSKWAKSIYSHGEKGE